MDANCLVPKEALDALIAEAMPVNATKEQAEALADIARPVYEALERLTQERDALAACDCIPAEFSSKGCPKCGRRGVVTETTIHTLMVEIRDKDAEVARLTAELQHNKEEQREMMERLRTLRGGRIIHRDDTE